MTRHRSAFYAKSLSIDHAAHLSSELLFVV